jgi:hypothetical protein
MYEEHNMTRVDSHSYLLDIITILQRHFLKKVASSIHQFVFIPKKEHGSEKLHLHLRDPDTNAGVTTF